MAGASTLYPSRRPRWASRASVREGDKYQAAMTYISPVRVLGVEIPSNAVFTEGLPMTPGGKVISKG